MKIQLSSGQTVDIPDNLQGQDALDFLDAEKAKIQPPGAGTRFMSGVYEGLGRQGEMVTNVLERAGMPGAAASTMEFANAMTAAPAVEQNARFEPGFGGTVANLGGRLFSDLPMIMGAMGAARAPLGVAEALTGKTILPQAGQTFLQQWPRVVGEAAVAGGMLEGATARPGVENTYSQAMKGAGEWAAGAAVLHPAFKALGALASKVLGRWKGDPTMTPEKASTDPNLPMVLDQLQKGKSEADIIIDLTQRNGVFQVGGEAPAGRPLLEAPRKELGAPTEADYMRAAAGEPYREGPAGQAEMILRRRGRLKPQAEEPPMDVSTPLPSGQGELPLTTRIRTRGGQAELPLESRGTLPTTGEPSVIYSPKAKRFIDKKQQVLEMDTGTGRIPGTERTTLPESEGVPPATPAPVSTGGQTGLDFTGVLEKQVPNVVEGALFKVGQKVRFQGKTRKITGIKGSEYILDDMVAVSGKDLKSVGGRRKPPPTEPTPTELAPSPAIPQFANSMEAVRYGLEHPEKAAELEGMFSREGTGKSPEDIFQNQLNREAWEMATRQPANLKSLNDLFGDDPELGPLIKKAMGEVTKPQPPFEKAPPPSAVEQVEVPAKLVDDLRSVGYDDEFIANLVADHGVEGATTLYRVKATEIANAHAKRDAQIRKALGKEVREVKDEDLSLTGGKELTADVRDDLINLADAMNDAETKAIAEGRALTEAEEEEIINAAIATGIEPVKTAAANVLSKKRTAADLLRDRLETMRARGVVESVPVTITKTGKVKEKPLPKETETKDEELLRLISEQEDDMMGRSKGYGPDKEGWDPEWGGAATKLLAALAGIGTTAAISPYAYYMVRDFVEKQQKRADELRQQLGKAELPEPQMAGISGAGLAALKDAVMAGIEKLGFGTKPINQTLEGGQQVLWSKNREQINPLSEWFVDPSRMADRLGKDVSDWWANLMKADNISGYNFKNHLTFFRDVESTLSKKEQLRMRDIMDGTIKPETDAERAAYGKIREFYDDMWGKVQESRKKVYEQNLTDDEYAAFKKVFDEGIPEATVLRGMPEETAEVMKEVFSDFRALRDRGKIEDYVTRHELGQYHLIEEGVTTEGKAYKKIVANAVSRKDAVRKAKAYFEANPDKRSLTIDSNGMIYDLATYLPKGSYYRIMGDLRRALKKDLSSIEEELGRTVGNKGEMARRAVRRAFTLKPSEKFSPYLQERKDILKGEENLFDILPAYAMSIEKKAGLDPVIAQARKLMSKIDDPAGRQWMANIVEDTKGRYWQSDRIVDTLLRNLGADVRPMAFSRSVGKIKSGEAMMKLGYRPVASLINRLGGEGHTWVKFGTETFLEAKRFMRTPEGKAFLQSVDPYMGVSYATDALGRIKPKENIAHPLGLFQAAELPNRETTLAAAFLHAQKNLGMNEAAAREYAIRQNWFTQFTYNVSSLPRILRTPTGRLLGQFKPYLAKEIEFIRQLSGRELVRYAGFQLAMGGPRGLIMLMKSLPILGGLAALDDAELWLNKNAPRLSRGVVGGATGTDVTAAATMQLPSKFEDWVGPFISDLIGIKKNAIEPLMKGEGLGAAAKGGWKSMESMFPIWRYWPELVVDRLITPGQKDFIIKDQMGRELYRLDWPDLFKEAAGAEPLESARIRTAQGILSRRTTAENKMKGQVIESFVKSLESGTPVPQELFDEMIKHHVSPASIRREMRFRQLPPAMRQMLRTELQRRMEVSETFPTLGE